MCTSGLVVAAVRNEARANFDFHYYLQGVLNHRDLPASSIANRPFLTFSLLICIFCTYFQVNSIQTTSIQVSHSQTCFPFDLSSPPLSALLAYFVQSVSVAACPSCQLTVTLSGVPPLPRCLPPLFVALLPPLWAHLQAALLHSFLPAFLAF